GHRITVRVDPEFVERLWREGLGSGEAWWIHDGRWVHVHHQDRLARVAWFGERIKICEIQACVSAGEVKVGTGVVVRHGGISSNAPKHTSRGDGHASRHVEIERAEILDRPREKFR